MEIWHNPRCSKSRQAKGLLEDAGVTFTERRYLEDVPSAERLAEVLGMLGLAPRDLVRAADAKTLGLEMDGLDDDAVIALMAANPRIIERPVVISDDGRAHLMAVTFDQQMLNSKSRISMANEIKEKAQ